MDPLFPVLPEDLAALSDEDLERLLAEHEDAAGLIDAEDEKFLKGLSADEILTQYEAGVDAIEALKSEQVKRVEAQATYLAKKDELAARRKGEPEVEEPEELAAEAPPGDPEPPEEPAPDEPQPDEPKEEEVLVATASGTETEEPKPEPAKVLPLRRPPAPSRERQPRNEEAEKVALVASSGVPRIPAGKELDWTGVAEAEIAVAASRGAPQHHAQGTEERIMVASSDFSHLFPEERKLYLKDPAGNSEKVKAIGSPFFGDQSRQALVASGGICAPLTPIYDLVNLSTDARPVRDALPNFRAERGGVSVPESSSIGDISTALTTITADNDALGGTFATKSCQALDCPDFNDVQVTVIAHCREFGNLNSITWPELVAHENEITMDALARTADSFLLTRIASQSIATTYNVGYGAVSVLIGGILQARAQIISLLRMDPGSRFRVLLPFWAADVYVWDLVNSQYNRFDTQREGVTAALARYGVDAAWYLDEASGTGQISGTQGAGALNRFNNDVYAYLFPEGEFLHIDLAALELGVVRDSTLNATNDYQIFGEIFENVIRVGPAQAALAIHYTVCPDGRVAAPEATEITCS